jgi:hypothetical protein
MWKNRKKAYQSQVLVKAWCEARWITEQSAIS